MMAAWGMREGIVSGARAAAVRAAEAAAAMWAAKWELAMPALVLVAMFSGFATAVEAAALTAVLRVRRADARPPRPVDRGAICCASSPSA